MENNIVDVHTAAKYFNKGVRRLQQYVEEGMPRDTKGNYDLLKCSKWRVEKLEDENEILRTAGDEKLYAQKMIGQIIKNKRDDLAYRKEILELVEKKAVFIAYSNQTGVINSKINSLEKDLDQIFDGKMNKKMKLKKAKLFNETRLAIGNLPIEKLIIDEEKIIKQEDK